MRSEVICGSIKMDVEVTGDDEFVRRGAAKERKELNSLRKMENGTFRKGAWVIKEGGRC